MEKTDTERGGGKELSPLDKFIHFLVEKIDPLLADLPEINCPEDSDEPNYKMLFDCKVTPDTYERSLYVTPPNGLGKEKHHSELIAEGLFTQEAFDEAAAAIEAAIRELPEYKEKGVFVFPLR